MSVKNVGVLLLFLLIVNGPSSAAPRANAAVVHQFQFNGNLNDDVGSLVLESAGGTIGAGSYSFGANQGLALRNSLINPGEYTLEMIFRFNALNGYRKILDFNDRASDFGLYTFNGFLDFYVGATAPSSAFSPGEDVRLIVTRDGSSNLFSAYVNGVQQLSFVDSRSLAVFSRPDRVIRFFKDDFVTGQTEATSGVVSFLRVYNDSLSVAEVGALGGPVAVPEPSTALIGALGMLCLGGRSFFGRRRNRVSAKTSAA